MSPTGLTVTGKLVFHAEPHRTRVSLDDVVPALGRLCRYNGAINWSVLHHLVLCDALVTRDPGWAVHPFQRAYVAAHDLHEAYVGDLVTGLKALLPGWREIEDAWEAHVHRSIGLDWPPPPECAAKVKEIDRLALALEVRALGVPAMWHLFPFAMPVELGELVHSIRARSHLELRAALVRALPPGAGEE